MFGINFLLFIHVVRDVFLSGRIYSLVYYPTSILSRILSFFCFVRNKIPAKYPCCPGCFSLWQDLFCCLLSDKDINNKLIINFLLTIRVVRDVFLSGKIDSLVYYPTRILYHYIIVLYYNILYYIILL